MEAIKTIIEWSQSLSLVPKSIASVVIALVSIMSVIIMWQTPSEKTDKPSSAGSGNQIGNATSSGQVGGITAGTYINQIPPVTERQKSEALAALKADLDEFADYPSRTIAGVSQTILEHIAFSKNTESLYRILDKYYKSTIKEVTYKDVDLLQYKQSYYDFRQKQLSIEQDMRVSVGQKVTMKVSDKWNQYVTYVIQRVSGHSQEALKSGGTMLLFDTTWDDMEKVYGEVIADPILLQRLVSQIAVFVDLGVQTQRIIDAVKKAD